MLSGTRRDSELRRRPPLVNQVRLNFCPEAPTPTRPTRGYLVFGRNVHPHQGERYYLWRAVDQDDQTLDILLQNRRNARAAKRFFREFLKGLPYVPNRLVTDELRSYAASHRTTFPSVPHYTNQ